MSDDDCFLMCWLLFPQNSLYIFSTVHYKSTFHMITINICKKWCPNVLYDLYRNTELWWYLKNDLALFRCNKDPFSKFFKWYRYFIIMYIIGYLLEYTIYKNKVILLIYLSYRISLLRYWTIWSSWVYCLVAHYGKACCKFVKMIKCFTNIVIWHFIKIYIPHFVLC